MAGNAPESLTRKLAAFGQEHVLRWWSDLTPDECARLQEQIQAIDFAQIASLVESRRREGDTRDRDASRLQAGRAGRPESVVRLPTTAEERERWEAARRAGEESLESGKVGAILVAGGQGTRLGFEKPKGVFPIGPVSRASLFQLLAEQVLARSRRAGRPIPYFVMTSDATHADTLAFFAENDYFGLPRQDVYFFMQGSMPAVDAATGNVLLADRGRINTGPDGHGGMLAALAKAGLLAEMARRGIEILHYHQVDNPTAIVCDPVFIGFHVLAKSEMSTKVVAKRSAEERMGVVVEVDGSTQIIEYSDLPPEVARKTDAKGDLLLWAGNTAIHVFDRDFLKRVVESASALPFHIAHKKVPYFDQRGKLIAPQTENAFKFERFIFDALPLAQNALVLETDRAREFNPVKNASGDDSPETAQKVLDRLYRDWLRAAGAPCDDSSPVEISPLFAVDADEVRAKVKPGSQWSGPIFLK